jgi:hypothetical protein
MSGCEFIKLGHEAETTGFKLMGPGLSDPMYQIRGCDNWHERVIFLGSASNVTKHEISPAPCLWFFFWRRVG